MLTLALAIALSGALLVQWAAVRVGVPGGAIQSQADTCIGQLRAANAALKAAAGVDASQGRNPATHQLSPTDPNVVNVLNCQTALVQIVGTPAQDASDDATVAADAGDNPVLDNVQQGAAGYTAGKCSFSGGFRDGTPGVAYNQPFTVTNNMGPGAQRTIAMTNPGPPASACGLDDDGTGSTWKGSCFVSADNTKGLSGQATVTVTGTTSFTLPYDEVVDRCPQGMQETSPGSRKCVLVPTASLNGDCTKAGVVPDNVKSAIKFDAAFGHCVVQCRGTAAFAWKPKPPTAALSLSPTSIVEGSGASVKVGWVIKNGKSASISPSGPTITLDASGNSAIATSIALGSVPTAPGKYTYTLTVQAADGVSPPAVATAQLEVKESTNKPSYTLTLSSGGNDVTTDTTVTVGGTITPKPTDGTTPTVLISVNGAPLMSVPAAGGSYFATVTLPKTTPSGALALVNPDRSLGTCGSHPPSAVFLGNTATLGSVQNVITATVTGAGGAAISNVGQVTITHAIRVVSARVDWSGKCSGASGAFPDATGIILRPADAPALLGLIPCGLFPCPGFKDTCAPVATVTVNTSVGSVSKSAVWAVNVQ